MKSFIWCSSVPLYRLPGDLHISTGYRHSESPTSCLVFTRLNLRSSCCSDMTVMCFHASPVPSAPLCSESFPSGVGSGCLSSGGGGTAGRTRTLPANRKPGDRHVSQSRGSRESQQAVSQTEPKALTT